MKKSKTKFFWTEGQVANVILAARGESKCPKAKRLVKKIDNKYHLKKKGR